MTLTPEQLEAIRVRAEAATIERALRVVEQWGEIVHAAWHLLEDQEQSEQNPKLLAEMTAYDGDYEIHDLYREDRRAISQLIEDIPALLAHIAMLEAEIENLRK